MGKKLVFGFLAFLLILGVQGNAWSTSKSTEVDGNVLTIMQPDRATLQKWIADFESAPKASIDKSLMLNMSAKSSQNLLSHLSYVPSERDQGYCGNCWVWAGTGVLAIAMDVQESSLDRLSVQYLNSCGSTGTDYACCGGWLSDLASFYTGEGQTIPWANTNASWQDYYQQCSDGSSGLSCGSLSLSPSYGIASITDEAIDTHGVGQAQAIANIKNVLLQNKAVDLGFFLPTADDWNGFYSFWSNQSESTVSSFDSSCGKTWDPSEGGGHAVLIVGYNDDDPSNAYWIVLNSWGTTAQRPNGLFRLDMNMDYDCTFYDDPYNYYSFYFETLDVTFDLAECSDGDGDGYGDPASTACTYSQEDCDDTNPDVNPGATEDCENSIDDDCDGLIDGADPNCGSYSGVANAEASTFGSGSIIGSGTCNGLALLLVPFFAVIFLRVLRKRK